MASATESIGLVSTQSAPAYGTAFAVAATESHTYYLTCRHVIDKLGTSVQIMVGLDPADLLVAGEMPLDLAILRVAGTAVKPSLRLVSGRIPEGECLAFGYKTIFGIALSSLHVKLGSVIQFEGATGRVPAREIHVADTKRIEPGYSGGPVLAPDLSGAVGIVSIRLGQGDRGLALATENLDTLLALHKEESALDPVRSAVREVGPIDLATPADSGPIESHAPFSLAASDKTLVREIIAICYRRAIFARLHAQIDLTAMFVSLAACRSQLQERVAYLDTPEAQSIVAEMISNLDLIERRKQDLLVTGSLDVREEINAAKRRIIVLLGGLANAGDVPLAIPSSLQEDKFWSLEEADEGPILSEL